MNPGLFEKKTKCLWSPYGSAPDPAGGVYCSFLAAVYFFDLSGIAFLHLQA